MIQSILQDFLFQAILYAVLFILLVSLIVSKVLAIKYWKVLLFYVIALPALNFVIGYLLMLLEDYVSSAMFFFLQDLLNIVLIAVLLYACFRRELWKTFAAATIGVLTAYPLGMLLTFLLPDWVK